MGTRSRKSGSFDRSELFKKNYYQRSDPDSISQNESYEIVTPSVSVSFGEEEGGFFGFFKKLIGNTDESKDAASSKQDSIESSDQESDENLNPLYESAPSPSNIGEYSVVHEKFLEAARKAIAHTRLFKDGKFSEVKTALNALNNKLFGSPNTSSLDSFYADIQGVVLQYNDTLSVMREYITHIDEKNGARSFTGRSRYKMVCGLIKDCERDLFCFTTVSRIIKIEDLSKIDSYNKMLFDARVLDLTNTTDQIETVGAGSSIIKKRTKQDGSSEFIKAEERMVSYDPNLDYDDDTSAIISEKLTKTGYEMIEMFRGSEMGEAFYKDAIEFFTSNSITFKSGKIESPEESVRRLIRCIFYDELKGFPDFRKKEKNESDSEYDELRFQHCKTNILSKFDEAPLFKPFIAHVVSSKELTFALADLLNVSGKKFVEAEIGNKAKIAPGSVISDRNVSTSIMAESLGMGDIVAHSDTVLMKNDKGDIIRANSMEGVSGTTLGKLQEEGLEAEKKDAEERKKLPEGKQKPPLKVKITHTPNSLVQLSNLFVLDLICAQVDRNTNNFICQCEKNPPNDKGEAFWYITSIKAIDNDIAFGELSFDDIFHKEHVGNTLSPLFKSEKDRKHDGSNLRGDYQSIYCISAEVYQRIMDYTPAMSELSQRHIRSDAEIKALQSRIEGVKKQLTDMLKDGKIILVNNNEDAELAYLNAMVLGPNSGHLYEGLRNDYYLRNEGLLRQS